MSQPVLSTRALDVDRKGATDLLDSITTQLVPTIGLSPIESRAVLQAHIELIDLAKAQLEEYRDLKAKFDRMASCR